MIKLSPFILRGVYMKNMPQETKIFLYCMTLILILACITATWATHNRQKDVNKSYTEVEEKYTCNWYEDIPDRGIGVANITNNDTGETFNITYNLQ